MYHQFDREPITVQYGTHGNQINLQCVMGQSLTLPLCHWHFCNLSQQTFFFFFVICCLTMFSISKRFQVVFYVCAEIKCRSRSCEVCCPAVLSLSHLEPITKHQYIDWSKCLSVLLCKHTVGLAVHVLSAWILSGFKSFSSSAPLIVAILAFEPRIWITPLCGV